jgi:hypothetical protein
MSFVIQFQWNLEKSFLAELQIPSVCALNPQPLQNAPSREANKNDDAHTSHVLPYCIHHYNPELPALHSQLGVDLEQSQRVLFSRTLMTRKIQSILLSLLGC